MNKSKGFERGPANKMAMLVSLYLKEEVDAIKSAESEQSKIVHAYAACRLKTVLMACGLPKDWPL